MRKIVSNLLILIILIGAGYLLMTLYLPPDKGQTKTPDSSLENQAKINENTSEKSPAKIEEMFKTIPADGKGIITPGISREIIGSDFWTLQYKTETAPIMASDQIASFNSDIIKRVPAVYDLQGYKSSLTKEELTNYIKHYKLPNSTMYGYDGKAIQQSFYDSLISNTNLAAIKDINSVRYGVAVKKASLRSFPTESGIYSSSSNRTLDRFQETGCEPCEPVIILHESKDKKWFFVQIYNYRGWIKSDTVGISGEEIVFSFTNPEKFLMVTGRSVNAEPENASSSLSKDFKMGTKIYLQSSDSTDKLSYYKVKLPLRNVDGSLDFAYATISKDADVYVGYLPYTRYNLITQSFKLQGIPYDWGDKDSGRDCSSFVMYIYKTFGINLPRNTDEQEKCSSNLFKFNAQDSNKQRLEIIDKLKPGAALYMPGHVMLYLGKSNNQHYIIHAFLGYGVKEGNVVKYQSINQIAVTTIQLANSEGEPFINKLTSAIQFEY